MKKLKRVRVNYRLRPDVKESVEQIATETGKTMTEVVEEAVKLYAEKKTLKQKALAHYDMMISLPKEWEQQDKNPAE
ncbi:MAG: ribbon-helix-helix protein, CopG family [Dehalococcoidia bacterium]